MPWGTQFNFIICHHSFYLGYIGWFLSLAIKPALEFNKIQLRLILMARWHYILNSRILQVDVLFPAHSRFLIYGRLSAKLFISFPLLKRLFLCSHTLSSATIFALSRRHDHLKEDFTNSNFIDEFSGANDTATDIRMPWDEAYSAAIAATWRIDSPNCLS